jgi:hypothetical protein
MQLGTYILFFFLSLSAQAEPLRPVENAGPVGEIVHERPAEQIRSRISEQELLRAMNHAHRGGARISPLTARQILNSRVRNFAPVQTPLPRRNIEPFTCFPTFLGEVKKIANLPPQSSFTRFSADGSRLFIQTEASLKVIDSATGRELFSIPGNEQGNMAFPNPSGDYLLLRTKDGLQVFSARDGSKLKNLPGFHSHSSASNFLLKGMGKTDTVYDIEKDEMIEIPNLEAAGIPVKEELTPSGKFFVRQMANRNSLNNETHVFSMETKTWEKLPGEASAFLPGRHNTILLKREQGDTTVLEEVDLATKERKSLSKGVADRIQASVLQHHNAVELKYLYAQRSAILDLETGRELAELSRNSFRFHNVANGVWTGIDSGSAISRVFDGVIETTNKVLPDNVDSVSFSSDGKIISAVAGDTLYRITNEMSCLKPQKVESEEESQPLKPSCKEDVGIENTSDSLPEKTLVEILGLLTKPEKFDQKTHLHYLVSALADESFLKKHSVLIGRVMEGVAIQSPKIYSRLFDSFPSLKILDLPRSSELFCRNESEQKKIDEKILSELKRVSQFDIPSLLNSFRPLRNSLIRLPSPVRADLVAKITERQRDRALDEYPGINASMLYYFINQEVKERLGDTFIPLTFPAIQRSRGAIHRTILGNEPLSGEIPSEETPYGFHFQRMDPIYPSDYEVTGSKVDLREKADLSWEHGGKKWNAKLSALATGTEYLNMDPNTLGHKEMLVDGVLAGLFFTGTNLGPKQQADTGNEAIAFFKDPSRGYQFEPPKIVDSKQFLQERIENGKLDYLVKNAHSGGEDWSVVTIPEKAKLVYGWKQRPDKKWETISVFMPTDDPNAQTNYENGIGVRISNEEFGQWIKTREKNGHGKFLYVSSSCHSCDKAVNELPAAASKNLILVPTLTSMNLFGNGYRVDPHTGTRELYGQHLLMDGFLKGLSNRQIEETFLQNSLYRRFKLGAPMPDNWGYSTWSGEAFALPGGELYKTHVLNKLEIPLELNLKVYDPSGKEVSFEELHAH